MDIHIWISIYGYPYMDTRPGPARPGPARPGPAGPARPGPAQGGAGAPEEPSRRVQKDPTRAALAASDVGAPKVQINYKNKGFGRSGWFSKSLNERIKIDFSLVHDPETWLFLAFSRSWTDLARRSVGS